MSEFTSEKEYRKISHSRLGMSFSGILADSIEFTE